jgi:hypothetical protein
MQSKVKAKQACTLHGPCLWTWSVLENWVNVPLTSTDWVMCPQLLPSVQLALDGQTGVVIFHNMGK